MFRKFATAKVTRTHSTRCKTANRKISGFDYEPKEGNFLYVAVRACTADVPNMNYDMLPSYELGEPKNAYKTFIGAYNYLNHDNQDPAKARGAIIDAVYHDDPDDKWVECLIEMDRDRCPKLCSLIESGEIDTVSMGCFLPGTKITLGDGTTKNIEDIVEGDSVLTHLGNVKRVDYVMEHEHNGMVYEISSFAQPTPMRLTEEHPVWVRRPQRDIADTVRGRVEKNKGSVTHKCTCGKEFATHRSLAAHVRETKRWGEDGEHGYPPSFEGWLEAKDVEIGDYVLDPVMSDVIPGDKRVARLLGYYLAEGNFCYDKNRNLPKGAPCGVEWTFNENEVDYHKEVSGLISELGYKSVGPYFKNGAATIRCNSPELAELMLELGGKYSWGKRIAENVMRWDIESQKALLEAYLNGDGSYGHGGRARDDHFSFSTVSKMLAEQIFTICVRCGVRCTEPICHDYSGRYSHDVDGENVVNRRPTYYAQGILGELGKGTSHLAYVDEKGMWRRVTKIRMLEYNGNVYNFEVEDDHSYVAEGCAVHNCEVSSTRCSICGNEAEYPFQFCEHIQQKGRVYNGKLAYEICNGVQMFELSWVYTPADPTAYTTTMIAGDEAIDAPHPYDHRQEEVLDSGTPAYGTGMDDELLFF